MRAREMFTVAGGCWCPPELTLQALRLMGHTEECSRARSAWRANTERLSGIERQRRADEAAGRQLREAAVSALAAASEASA